MEILRKLIDCKSLENSLGNSYDAVSFGKVISLQFSDCNFAIKRIHHRFFLENVRKTSYLNKKQIKSNFEEKVYSGLNKAAAFLYTTLNFI